MENSVNTKKVVFLSLRTQVVKFCLSIITQAEHGLKVVLLNQNNMYLNVGKKEDLKKQKTRGSHESVSLTG
jgi:hypothetical protein